MNERKLLVKQLSNTGELLRVITCFSGQVSVFRATSPNALRPFQRAFVGLPGPEKIAISVDEEPFTPAEHTLIGFGERWSDAEQPLTATKLLEASGVAPGVVRSLLLTAGLDHVAEKPCGSLSPSEERRIRLLSALQNVDSVLVLNDPFDPLEPQWRERFAENLIQHVRTTPRIVVITSLNQRPEAWIDNERVARIQVGETVQRTIGFGSQNSELKDLLAQVRAEASKPAAEPAAPSSTVQKPDITAVPKLETPRADRRRSATFAVLTLLLVIGGIAAGMAVSSPESDSVDIASKSGNEVPDSGRKAPEAGASEAHASAAFTSEGQSAVIEAAAPTVLPEPTAIPSPPEPIQLVLNLYPEDIRSSIIQSFEGISDSQSGRLGARGRSPRVSLEAARGSAPAVSQQPAQSSSNELLRVLQSTSNATTEEPTKSPEAVQQPEDVSNLSPEQRREVIRQRFLEAIQRASQQNQ